MFFVFFSLSNCVPRFSLLGPETGRHPQNQRRETSRIHCVLSGTQLRTALFGRSAVHSSAARIEVREECVRGTSAWGGMQGAFAVYVLLYSFDLSSLSFLS
jgi:hypothetical protein